MCLHSTDSARNTLYGGSGAVADNDHIIVETILILMQSDFSIARVCLSSYVNILVLYESVFEWRMKEDGNGHDRRIQNEFQAVIKV